MRIESRIIQPNVAGASISGSGSGGQISYWSGASSLSGNSNFLFDSTNQAVRLGSTDIVSSTREKLTVRYSPASADAAGSHACGYFQYLNSNNTAFSSFQRCLVSDWRRTITTDTTDTNSFGTFDCGVNFNVGAGATYTINDLYASTFGLNFTGAGALAISRFTTLRIASNSVNTGTRKIGLWVGAQTGATNNTLITDSSTFTAGNWTMIFSGTNPSSHAGAFYVGGTTVHSFNAETLSVQASPTGDANTRAVIAALLTPTGNTAFTGADVHAITGGINRTITSSTTDTVGRYAAILARQIWSVSGGQTLTHTQTGGVNYFSTSGFPAVTGTLAITHFAGYNMPAISTVTGTNFYGVRIQGITGANTSNYGYYCGDISGATNNYSWYSGSGAASYGDYNEFRANHDPGTPTDAVRLSAKDTTEGSPARTFHFRTESAPEADATFTQSHRLRIWINNVEYFWALEAV